MAVLATYSYTLINNNTEYEITCNNKSTCTEAIIPSTYNGLPVTKIYVSAFEDCTLLTNVVIGNNVRDIGTSAFWGCSSLKSIEIPNSVTSIGDLAFYRCSSLTNIEIPDSVTSIGRTVFNECSSLTSIVIPDSVTSIGDSVFHHCTSLTSIVLPNSLTSIGSSMFYECNSLTTINIPNNLTSIGITAFYNCTSLTSIVLPNSVTSIGNGAFGGCASLTTINIPNNLTSIGQETFFGCALTSIEIPDSVTSIGPMAFGGCGALTRIEIPDSVTSIGQIAFAYCVSLTSVVIPNSVQALDLGAFGFCTALTSVIIGENTTAIQDQAFYGCSSLKSMVLMSKTPPTLGSNVFLETPQDIKIYCYFSAVNDYKTATNWNSYANNIVGDDIAVSFASNAQVINKTFVKKVDLPPRLQEVGLSAKQEVDLNARITFDASMKAIIGMQKAMNLTLWTTGNSYSFMDTPFFICGAFASSTPTNFLLSTPITLSLQAPSGREVVSLETYGSFSLSIDPMISTDQTYRYTYINASGQVINYVYTGPVDVSIRRIVISQNDDIMLSSTELSTITTS